MLFIHNIAYKVILIYDLGIHLEIKRLQFQLFLFSSAELHISEQNDIAEPSAGLRPGKW